MKKHFLSKTLIVLGAVVGLTFGIVACGKSKTITVTDVTYSGGAAPTFEFGTSVDITGQMLNIRFSNGTTTTVQITDEMWNKAAAVFNTVGDHDITVTFTVKGVEQTYSFRVKITEPWDVTNFKQSVDSYESSPVTWLDEGSLQSLIETYNNFSTDFKNLAASSYTKLCTFYKTAVTDKVREATANGKYRSSNYEARYYNQIQEILAGASARINAATDLSGVDAVVDAIFADMDAVPSRLDSRRISAKAEVEGYLANLTASNYTEANFALITGYVNEAKTYIEDAWSLDAINSVVLTCKNQIDNVDTIASSNMEAMIEALIDANDLTLANIDTNKAAIDAANTAFGALDPIDMFKVSNHEKLARLTVVSNKIIKLKALADESDYESSDWENIYADMNSTVAQIKAAEGEVAMDMCIGAFESSLSSYLSYTVAQINATIASLPELDNLTIAVHKDVLTDLRRTYNGLASGQKERVVGLETLEAAEERMEILVARVAAINAINNCYDPADYADISTSDIDNATFVAQVNQILALRRADIASCLEAAETAINNDWSLEYIESDKNYYINQVSWTDDRWYVVETVVSNALMDYVSHNDTYAYFYGDFSIGANTYHSNQTKIYGMRDDYDARLRAFSDDGKTFAQYGAGLLGIYNQAIEAIDTENAASGVTKAAIRTGAITYLSSKYNMSHYSAENQLVVDGCVNQIIAQIDSDIANENYESIVYHIDDSYTNNIAGIRWDISTTVTAETLYNMLNNFDQDANRYVRVGETRSSDMGLINMFINYGSEDHSSLYINGTLVNLPSVRIVTEGNKKYIEISVLALLFVRSWQQGQSYYYIDGLTIDPTDGTYFQFRSQAYSGSDTYRVYFPYSIDGGLDNFFTGNMDENSVGVGGNGVSNISKSLSGDPARTVTNFTTTDRHYAVTYSDSVSSLGIRVIKVAYDSEYDARYFIFTNPASALTIMPDALVDTAVRADGEKHYTILFLGIHFDGADTYEGYASADHSVTVTWQAVPSAAKEQVKADLDAYVAALNEDRYSASDWSSIGTIVSDAKAALDAIDIPSAGNYYVINSKPSDWESGYMRYYTAGHTAVQAVAPEFIANTYYKAEYDYRELIEQPEDWDYEKTTKYYRYDSTILEPDYVFVSAEAVWGAETYYVWAPEYILVESKPADWDTDYMNHFIYKYEGYYNLNSVAPEFEPNTYYRDANGQKYYALDEFENICNEAIADIRAIHEVVHISIDAVKDVLKDFGYGMPADQNDIEDYVTDSSGNQWIDLGTIGANAMSANMTLSGNPVPEHYFARLGFAYPFYQSSNNGEWVLTAASVGDFNSLIYVANGHVYMNVFLFMEALATDFEITVLGSDGITTEFVYVANVASDFEMVDVSAYEGHTYENNTHLTAEIDYDNVNDEYTFNTSHYGNTFEFTLDGMGTNQYLHAYIATEFVVYQWLDSYMVPDFNDGRTYFELVNDEYVRLTSRPADWDDWGNNCYKYRYGEYHHYYQYQKVLSDELLVPGRFYEALMGTMYIDRVVDNPITVNRKINVVLVNDAGDKIGLLSLKAIYNYVLPTTYENIRIVGNYAPIYELGETMDETFPGLVVEGLLDGHWSVLDSSEYDVMFYRPNYESLRDGNVPGSLVVSVLTKIGSNNADFYVEYVLPITVAVNNSTISLDRVSYGDMEYYYNMSSSDSFPLSVSITLPNGWSLYDDGGNLIADPTNISIGEDDLNLESTASFSVRQDNGYSQTSVEICVLTYTAINSMTVAGISAERTSGSSWRVDLDGPHSSYPLVVDLPAGYTYSVMNQYGKTVSDTSDLLINVVSSSTYFQVTIKNSEGTAVEKVGLTIYISNTDAFNSAVNQAIKVGLSEVASAGIFSGGSSIMIAPFMDGNHLGVFMDAGATLSVLDEEGNEIYDSANHYTVLNKTLNFVEVYATYGGNKYYARLFLINTNDGYSTGNNALYSMELLFWYNDTIELDDESQSHVRFNDTIIAYYELDVPKDFDATLITPEIIEAGGYNDYTGWTLEREIIDNGTAIKYQVFDGTHSSLGYVYVILNETDNAIDDNTTFFLIAVDDMATMAEVVMGGMSLEDALAAYGVEFQDVSTEITSGSDYYAGNIARYYRGTLDDLVPGKIILGGPANEYASIDQDTSSLTYLVDYSFAMTIDTDAPAEFTCYVDVTSADGTTRARYIIDCVRRAA